MTVSRAPDTGPLITGGLAVLCWLAGATAAILTSNPRILGVGVMTGFAALVIGSVTTDILLRRREHQAERERQRANPCPQCGTPAKEPIR